MMTDAELLQRYAETVTQLRATGWSDAKIIASLRRKTERDSSKDTTIPARFVRRGDVLSIAGNRRLVSRTQSRKSDDTMRVFYAQGDDERFNGDDLLIVLRRDTLTFPTGPPNRYGI